MVNINLYNSLSLTINHLPLLLSSLLLHIQSLETLQFLDGH